MTLVGHATQIDQLVSSLAPSIKRRVYGVIGPEGVGRVFFIKEALIRSGIAVTPASTDIRVLSSDTVITVDVMKECLEWLSIRPLLLGSRILIVDPLERVTPEAQSFLLKALEEPPSHALIFLVASSEIINAAILSRLLVIRLFCLGKLASEKIWDQQNINNSVYKDFWDLAPGQPGLAVKRYGLKYHQLFAVCRKLFANKVTPIKLLHTKDIFISMSPNDVHIFWQWALPKLYVGQSPRSASNNPFISMALECLQHYPQADLSLLLPSLLYNNGGK